MEDINTNTNILQKDEWYQNTKDHWENIEPSINGMLGGNEEVNESDVKTSCEFLEGLIKTKKINPKKVLDCGAGIGRVTTYVLQNYFEEIDIMEQEQKYVDYCIQNFKENTKIKNIYQSGLQEFKFESKYNVIWAQWCLENLDDDDLIIFLNKCKLNLEDDGCIVVKENIVSKGSVFCKEDYSRVRSDVLFKGIFNKCGLKIIKHFHQPNWPKDLLKVSIFLLKMK
jgi:protein N-terminal methyltransferase